MKISIDAELNYRFAPNSQIVANLEASLTPDQHILEEMLTVTPSAPLVRDTVASGDRRIRGCFNGDVTIR